MKMYKSYNNILEPLKIDQSIAHVYINGVNEDFKIDIEELDEGKAMHLCQLKVEDQVLFKFKSEEFDLCVYSIKHNIYAIKERRTKERKNIKGVNIYKMKITNEKKYFTAQQTGVSSVSLYNEENEFIAVIEDIHTKQNLLVEIDYFMEKEPRKKRFITLSKIQYKAYYVFVVYDDYLKKILVMKNLFKILQDNEFLTIEMINQNEIKIKNKLESKVTNVSLKRIGFKPKKIFDITDIKYFGNSNVLSIISVNNTKFFVYLKRNGVFIVKNNPLEVTQYKSNLKPFAINNHVYFVGRMTHHAFNSFKTYDYLYVKDSERCVAKFVRPFSKFKLLKRFGYFKFSLDKLEGMSDIHNKFFIGNRNRIIHNLSFKENDEKVKTYLLKKRGKNLHVIRTTLGGNITSTIVPHTEEYGLRSKMKIQFARYMSKFYKNKTYNVNLFFEKKSKKADESSFAVFEKVAKKETSRSKNYFILDANSDQYTSMKKRFGDAVIKKFSFKHYLAIFNASYYISSELSNHVLNDRVYIESLRDKIMETPLIFLQHGIMFAKPVDNPMAFGFHKDKNKYNIYKNVISSELEAGEFYKMKYKPEDLMLTGLATFDKATLNPGANKIAFMPTYRYWEEGLIYANNIEETTYYKTIIKVIRSFEKAGLLDRLLIVPHNKFSDFIYDNMPQYRDIISNNPSEALKEAKVFITDYSSAVYDAQYRGAYPIFYWEEKNYLIEKYQATPALNEENAPGPIAWNVDELVMIAQKAVQQDYQLEEEYKEKYKKINSFDDNKNTERIIEFLEKENIL